MLPQRDSILQLLADEDSETAGLVQNQLVACGREILNDLRELLPSAHGRAERRLREVLAELERKDAEVFFANLCATFDDHGDVEAAAWALAAVMLPGEDFADAKALLDGWGVELRQRAAGSTTPAQHAMLIADLLGGEISLRGNEDDYYAFENSMLPSVITSKLGIPITLSLVYMAVGRRAGIKVEGVGLPGHFIVRLGNIFLDPFHGGRRIGLEDCEQLLGRQGLTLQPYHLMPCKPRVMLARMLNNLLHLTEHEGAAFTEKVMGWLQSLQRAAV